MKDHTTYPFNALLKQLRKRAGMTQSDLAAALGYSISFVCALEKGQRLPDLEMVMHRYVPALGLQDIPHLATQLVNAAAYIRGERPPTMRTHQREGQAVPVEEGKGALSHLPRSPTQLIGRQLEVAQLSKRLLGHYGRLLTLVGPPGIGKTRLALAVAEHLQPHYDDGVLFAPLATVSNAESMATIILTLLDRRATTTNSPQAQLCAFLQRKTMLLVLDNLEQIDEAAAFIADLLTQCPTIVILATSRERLYLRAEQRYKVPPLALAAAVELFEQRAQSLGVEFMLTPDTRKTIEAICNKLDCLPLAIELSVARLDLFSPTDLLIQIEDRRLDLLSDQTIDLPIHQRTLRNALHRSYSLLAEAMRPCFCALSVFVGDFDIAAAVAIGCPEETLQVLQNKSLVQVKPLANGEQRFILLETIRDYALEQLQQGGTSLTGGGLEVQQRHAHYFLHLTEQLDPTATSHIYYWIQRLNAEYLNIRAALTWTLQHQQVENAVRFAWMLRRYWSWHDWGAEGKYWIQRILKLAEQAWVDQLIPPEADLTNTQRQQLANYIKALFISSEYRIEDSAECYQIFERCQLLDQRYGLSALTPLIYHGLANCCRSQGDYAKHDALQHEFLQLLPSIPDLPENTYKNVMSWSVLYLGCSAAEQAEWGLAEQYFQNSHQLFHENGSKLLAAMCSAGQCFIACQRGELTKAQQLLDAYRDELVNIGLTATILWVDKLAGLIAIRAGDTAEAVRILSQGMARLPQMDMAPNPKNDQFPILLQPLIEVALQTGQMELAACLLGAANRSWSSTYHLSSLSKSSIIGLTNNTVAQMPAADYQKSYTLGYNMTSDTLVAMVIKWLDDLSNPDR